MEGSRTFLTAFEVRVSGDDTLDTEQVTEHVMTLHEDFAVTRTLPRGENGFIDKEGRVFINRRDSADPELTGTIEGFSEEQFIFMNSAGLDPKFALEKLSLIHI